MSGNERLITILDREFRRLEKSGERPFTTVQLMAERLGLDKASLSRFRQGQRDLTRKKAIQIAKRFRQGDDAAALELADELMAASTAPPEHEIKVVEWLKERKREGCLMLVEFRELPVVRPGGGKQHLAKEVAAAVVGGQNYGMFFPYNLANASSIEMPTPLVSYLLNLRSSVISTYVSIREHILEEVFHQKPTLEEGELRIALTDAIKRLKLYVLAQPDSSTCPAIGYRLFYVEEDDSNPQAQRWEWISLHDGDQMIQKQSTEQELEATAIRFFPVVEYWRHNGLLPQNSPEMEGFTEDLNRESYIKERLHVGRPQWKVFDEETDEELVAQQFLDRQKGTSES